MKLIDTNIIIYLLRYQPDYLKIRFAKEQKNGLCISAITLAELRKGVEISVRKESAAKSLAILAELFTVLPLTDKEAGTYAQIWSELRRKGITVGDFDLLIAATALTHDLTLVTNNTKDFCHIPGLTLEDWLVR